MIEKLSIKNQWIIAQITEGDVPRMNCRSAHLVGSRARKYQHVVINRSGVQIQLIEIELSENESLSTFLFRNDQNPDIASKLLESLMSSNSSKRHKAVHWKQKFNSGNTISREYLEHPEKKAGEDPDALDSWVLRAEIKIMKL